MYKVELVEMDGGVGFVVPDEIVSSLKLSVDSTFNVIENPDSVELIIVAPNDSGQ